ncbi:MAG: TonB-dependent siderophore receptor [Alphaproteobacteria bacterium]|nr:TonB-dependent siderophore receptor [Alphaproteobacteria bacterium]
MSEFVQSGITVSGALCLTVAALCTASAQTAPAPAATPPQQAQPAPTSANAPSDRLRLQDITVRAPQRHAVQQQRTSRPRSSAVAAHTASRASRAPADTQSSANLGVGNFGSSPGPALHQAPSLGKTGTRLQDLPATVQIIPRDVLNQQGATLLREAISNASGIVEGGQDGRYFDLFLIRGLNAQIYNDGFSDGDQLGGLSHSLNGVQRVEILNGPGSALFGSGPPGGTVNIVHFTPSSEFHYGSALQAGSFGSISNTSYVTGPTTIAGLNYRIDVTATHTDGFRDLKNSDYEIRPDLTWQVGNHSLEFTVDARQLQATPDSYGIIYFNGTPLKTVPITAKYSMPFSYANYNYLRSTVSDKWWISDALTINSRFSYLNRSLDMFRSGDSSKTKVSLDPDTYGEVIGRQARQQRDTDNSFDYQFEPVWKFNTGAAKHTLLTGFEASHSTIDTQRSTADLPNIANAFAPVPPEMSANGLVFQCRQGYSCDNDHLAATYLSLYATDQIDLTDRFKLRVGVRKDWWETSLTPLITVPGRFNNEGVPVVAGITQQRRDAPVSWNVGALYKLFPGVSPYVGVSRSFLSNFNSENTQTGIGAPESALQYEAGIKFSLLNDRVTLSTAVFDLLRENVASPLTVNDIETVVFDSQRTRGFEAALDARLTEQWRVFANVTAQKAVITDNPQGITSVGNHPQGVPAYMANLWSTYSFSIAGRPGFTAGLGVNYRDRSYSDITNVNSIPAFVVANAFFGYEEKNWGISLNVKNFTNQRYYTEANAAGAIVGDPLSAFVKIYIKH